MHTHTHTMLDFYFKMSVQNLIIQVECLSSECLREVSKIQFFKYGAVYTSIRLIFKISEHFGFQIRDPQPVCYNVLPQFNGKCSMRTDKRSDDFFDSLMGYNTTP